ncbi:threonine--tRNA ligase [Methanosphaera sp. BMS]|uniref:threonine--tRNA ligase n=1 Tax=Methanosphaera sp. BMS TaxID=1789762 RepID=UPI000DC1E489|nr:threonine--tRNA ligase [Methanosphaera sp. BMS]AWX32936.1 threonine--tRNA ligase [Methanosphaera sp. BMS]
MRTLMIHSDYLRYKTRSKTKIAEDIDDEKRDTGVDDALVAFIAVEKEDEENPEIIIKKSVKEILNVQNKVNAKNIVVYPYAHLSSSLSNPDVAQLILKGIEAELISNNEAVMRVPFGWYKSFELSCKGHPLSELSRTITTEVDEEEDEVEEEKQPSKFYILEEDGKQYDVDDYNYQNKTLKQLVHHEQGLSHEDSGKQPPHVKLMKEKELASNEPSADVGHIRWYPKGKLVKDLLGDYVYNLVTERGAMPVDTPVMYDLADPAIREHAAKFGERQYRLKTKHKELMLRFACCFGAFRIMADSFLTWKNMPVGIYELSQLSFRFERQGEVVGLKRLRAFTMPDFHSVCLDDNHAKEVFEGQVDMCAQTETDLNVHYEVAFRVTEEFYAENEDWVKKVVKQNIKKPVLLEVIPKMKHYWNAKVDFAAIDDLGRPIENPTVQMDIQSARRFGITYLDENEQQQYPTILHCSPTGSLERVICSLLEKTSTDKGNKPSLPLWLSPTQVRIIPVTDNHLEYAEDVYCKLRRLNVRVDVDDTAERLGKKIRNAGKEWIPYTIVVGDNEVENNSITVNRRDDDSKQEVTVEELANEIHTKTDGMPFRQLPLPYKVSKRVKF